MAKEIKSISVAREEVQMKKTYSMYVMAMLGMILVFGMALGGVRQREQ
jgi:hypothetical protein